MKLRVVGAGLGRTGTLSLRVAFEQLLGAPCYHMAEVFAHMEHIPVWTDAANGRMPDWNKFLEGYAAAVDWPSSAFWPELSRAFPQAIVLLSERPAEKWWESADATIFNRIERSAGTPWYTMIEDLFRSRFTTNIHDRDAAIAAYEKHNARVRAEVPADRLLIWSPGDGWEPICARLGLPVPATPFPHVNSREEWLARHPG